ncbi:MAG: ABC transporter [Deltaproteobacteria bacterium]|nr:MAG: ABC transporter [Deltaproteobacteria bacterium]
MGRILRDIYSVWWADLRILKRFWPKFLITCIISPILYLFVFGFGLGRRIKIEGTSYLEFVIPGIIALTAMNTSFNSAGMKLNVDRLFYKSFDEFLMAPISSFSLILGKSLIGVVRGLIISCAFLLIGIAFSPLRVNFLFGVTLLVTCFTFAFLGVLAALIAKSHQDMSTFTSMVLRPMTFLGGTFFSLDDLPKMLKIILNIIPLTHASQCLRAITLGQAFPWLSLLILVSFGLVFLIGCIVIVKMSSV